MSINYQYVIDWIKDYAFKAKLKNPRVLDFGCGGGAIVKAGVAQAMDMWGADPYEGIQGKLHGEASSIDAPANRILKIENNVLPYPDNHFDIVVSNQVFEHVHDLERPLSEIRRVLRPGGAFLALFPVNETMWEGHCQLYLAHWLKPHSPLQLAYLTAMRKLGLGFKNGTYHPEAWAKEFASYLQDYCFYRSSRTINREWEKKFGAIPHDLNSHYMLYRLERSRLSFLTKFFANPVGLPILAFLCKMRAGRIILVTSQKAASSAG